MAANIEAMMEQAKRALREGNKYEAQQFLMKITELDQYNAEAWLWLASTVETEEEKRTCLDNVLIINPEHNEAKRILAEMDRGSFDSGSSFDDGFGDNPAGGTETSGNASVPAFEFGDDPFGGSDPFAPDTTASSNDPFSGEFSSSFDVGTPPPPPDIPTTSSSSSDLSGGDGPFSSDLFSGEADITPDSMESNLFADDTATPPPPSSPPAETYDNSGDTSYNDTTADDYNSGLEDAYDDIAYADDIEDDLAPNYLEMIPVNIKPTRIPGMDEQINQSLVTGIVVLAILNVLAIVGIVVQFII